MAIYGSLVNSDAGGALGFKNLLINGNFDVWQRATTYTSSNIGSYQTADRWYMSTNGGVNVTYSQQALGFDQNGKSNSMRVQRASGSSGRFYLTQLMETTVLNRCRGKSVTLSYWAKRGSDLGATDVVVRVGTQTSETSRDDAKVQYLDSTPSLSTSWQKFSHTLTLTSTSDSASGFLVEFVAERAGGTNVWYEVAQVQLEIGSVATPFEFRSYQQELALCQRYYETLETQYLIGIYENAYSAFRTTRLNFKVTKRTSPTASYASGGTMSWAIPGLIGVSASSNTGMTWNNSVDGCFLVHLRQAGGSAPTNQQPYLAEGGGVWGFSSEL
jgi:hypothetical protein